MTHPTPLTGLLAGSKLEQLPLLIYFQSGCIKGIVTRLDEETVTLRTPEGKSCLLLIARIDAIVQE
jgi:hypothetical protein